MFKAIKNFLNSFINRRQTLSNEYTFTIIGDVLIVQIPVGKMVGYKVEEFCTNVVDSFNKIRDELGISHVIGVPKYE